MAAMDLRPQRGELEATAKSSAKDYNRHHFVRYAEFEWRADKLDPANPQGGLWSSLEAELHVRNSPVSLLYKGNHRRIKEKKPCWRNAFAHYGPR